MARGKYAARAANQQVAKDGEIIRENLAEIAALTQQVAQLRQELADERRERDALVLRRAEQRATAAQDAAQRQVDKLRDEQAQRDRETAQWLARLMRWVNENTTPNWLSDNELENEDSDAWPYVFPMHQLTDGAGRIIYDQDSAADCEVMLKRLVGQHVGDLLAIAYGELKPRTRRWRRGRFKDIAASAAKNPTVQAVNREVMAVRMGEVHIHGEEDQT